LRKREEIAIKAAVLRGPGRMEIEDLPEPDLPEGGALLKMEACAVCGTDIKMLEQGHRDLVYPCIPGHELVGRIAQTDGGDGGCHYRPSAPVREGDLVAVWPGIACGGCLPCRRGDDGRCRDIKIMGFNFPGGFAEMCALPAESLYSGTNLLPRGTDPAIASLSEPLACCINGQEQAHLCSGESVLIFGGGPIGALHALLAGSRGAGSIIISEKLAGRLSILRRNTRSLAFNPDEEGPADVVAAETDGVGVDVILTATPAVDTDSSLLRMLSPGGRLCIFSGPSMGRGESSVDMRLLHYREVSICGSYGCSSRHCRQAAELLTSGRIRADWLITKRAGLMQINEAFAHSAERAGMKSVVFGR